MKHSSVSSERNPFAVGLSVAVGVSILVAIAIFIFLRDPNGEVWAQGYNPTGHWQFSTLLAALPVVVLLGAMAGLRLKAHIAALAGLVAALLVAIVAFHMPVKLAVAATIYGAGYGIFPICWIVLPVIFLYQLTVKTGQFEALQKSLTSITDDGRLQLLLIAFAFGAFFEGCAGFGAPVAVCGAILISLGFKPIEAAGLSLLANTAPVAFGSLGIPVIALHAVTGVDILVLSKVIAILLAPFCVLVPFWLIWAYSGFKAMLEVWPAILVTGLTFSATQLAIGVLKGPWLVDIAAAAASILVLIVFLRFWKPIRTLNAKGEEVAHRERSPSGSRVAWKAWMPWLILGAMVFAWGIPGFSRWADESTTVKIPVAGLHNMVERVPPVVTNAVVEPAIFNLNWLAATGTGTLFSALLAGLFLGLGPVALVRELARTVVDIRFTVLTISAMMALGFVSRYCGLDATLGLAFARSGALYPFFGTLIGWLGTATTGSDTSSNVLFGSLQTMTARQIGVSPALMASANSVGGVMGKMIAAPSIVVASTATRNYGQEGTILRFVLLHSLALATLAGVFVYLLAYVAPFSGIAGR